MIKNYISKHCDCKIHQLVEIVVIILLILKMMIILIDFLKDFLDIY